MTDNDVKDMSEDSVQMEVQPDDISYAEDQGAIEDDSAPLVDPDFLEQIDVVSTHMPPVDLSVLFDADNANLMPRVLNVGKRKMPLLTANGEEFIPGQVELTAEPAYSLIDVVDDVADEIKVDGRETRQAIITLSKKIDALVSVLQESGSMTASQDDVRDLQIVVDSQRAFINMVLKLVPEQHSAAIAKKLSEMTQARAFQEATARLADRNRRRKMAMGN